MAASATTSAAATKPRASSSGRSSAGRRATPARIADRASEADSQSALCSARIAQEGSLDEIRGGGQVTPVHGDYLDGCVRPAPGLVGDDRDEAAGARAVVERLVVR